MRNFLISVLILTLALSLSATPYLTPEEWESRFIKSAGDRQTDMLSAGDLMERLARLTDEGYSYLFEYTEICDFLTVWQVSDPLLPDYGGMIEGETGNLTTIIQTDNTQESIRVWSHFGAITGDAGRYQDNIAAAWTYTMNFPAYSEEGETDYYRMHNCGWGLVAQMEYESVYNDTTFRVYADSCADFMITHRLSFTQGAPFYQQLHPLVTGWAAGTLYQYGLYRNEQAYVDTALIYGEMVKNWIEENPQRLNANEVWAMSGGTAMWGVVHSIFQDDPSAAEEWLEQFAPYMDVYSGPGEWNNSWNIWYSHAYHGMFDLTSDSLYLANAVFLVDTLLSQDTDNDGGIPAGTADPDTMDQTWVSCYTDYMGIESILLTLPSIDVGVSSFEFPMESVPISVNANLFIRIQAANYGNSVLQSVAVEARVGTAFLACGLANLEEMGMGSATLSPGWQPPDTGLYTIIANTIFPGDENPDNDTLAMQVEVRGYGTICGAVTDALSGNGISCVLNFYNQDFSNYFPAEQIATAMPGGEYSVDVLTGPYRIEVIPEIPYNIKDFEGMEVFYGETTEYNIALYPAPLLLVDDDGGDWFENYYYTALAEAGYEYYYWDYEYMGSFAGETSQFPNCIWFTGDEETETLQLADKTELETFLSGGGNLILTGQYIGDDLGSGDAFLNDYLQVDHEDDDVNQFFVEGITGNPISENTVLFMIGSPGAGNQDSPSSCTNLPGGEILYVYQTAPNPVAAVSYYDNQSDYNSIYFGFGLEGISGLAGTDPLHVLLGNIFTAWGYSASAALPEEKIPLQFVLYPAYPNPFNPLTKISYSLASTGMTELVVYNLLGQETEVLWRGVQSPGYYSYDWNTGDAASLQLSSGIYICRLSHGQESYIQKLILLK